MGHPLLLLLLAICGYVVHRYNAKIYNALKNYVRSIRWVLLAVLILVVASLITDFPIHFNAGTLGDVIFQILIGFVVGWLFSLQMGANLDVTMPKVVSLGLLLIIGTGPLYWRNWLDVLGVKKLGDIEFRGPDITLSSVDPKFILEKDKEVKRKPPMRLIVQLTDRSMQWDFCYTMKYGDQYGLDPNTINKLNDKVKTACNGHNYYQVLDFSDDLDLQNVQNVLDSTIVHLAECYEKYEFSDNSVRVSDILRPFAGDFSELLRFAKASRLKARQLDQDQLVKIAERLWTTLDAAIDGLYGIRLPSLGSDEKCSEPKRLGVQPLKEFVTNGELNNYPYETIALAYLLDRIGEKKIGAEYISEWITSYQGSTRSINLVRAHVTLDQFIDANDETFEPEESGEFLLGYYTAIENLLYETELRVSVDSGQTYYVSQQSDGCKGYSTDDFIAPLLFLRISVKNNFVFWAVENRDTRHFAKIQQFTRDIGECRISDYVSKLFPSYPMWIQYHEEAYFQDTYAHAILFLHDHENSIISRYDDADRRHYAETIEESIMSWTKAENHLHVVLTEYQEEAADSGVSSDTSRLLRSIRQNIRVAEKRLAKIRGY